MIRDEVSCDFDAKTKKNQHMKNHCTVRMSSIESKTFMVLNDIQESICIIAYITRIFLI